MAEDSTKTEGERSAAVQEELERLLSKENLAEDQVIAAALDPQLCVPVAVLLERPSIKALTSEAADLVAAAEKSPVLGVSNNGAMIRPLLKSKRNTVILRPADGTTEDELKELLSKAPKTMQELREDVNGTWFVVFGSEEEAQDAAWWLRSQKVRDEKMSVSMKSEHFLRSFFPANPEPKVPGPEAKGMPMPFPFPFGFPSLQKGAKGKGKKGKAAPAAMLPFLPPELFTKGGKKGRKGAKGVGLPFPPFLAGMPFMPGMPGMPGMPMAPPVQAGLVKGSGKAAAKEAAAPAAKEEKPEPVTAQVATVLGSRDKSSSPTKSVAELCEYKHEFRKYTRADFVNIIGDMKHPIPQPEVYSTIAYLKICGDSSSLGLTGKPTEEESAPKPAAAAKVEKKPEPKAKAKAKKKAEPEYTEAEWEAWNAEQEKAKKKPAAQAKQMKWVAKK